MGPPKFLKEGNTLKNETLEQTKCSSEAIGQKPVNLLGMMDFPEEVVILFYQETQTHLCLRYGYDLGLAVFSNEYYATRFLEHRADLPQLVFQQVEFETARELVRSIPTVPAIHFMDDVENPIVHWIEK